MTAKVVKPTNVLIEMEDGKLTVEVKGTPLTIETVKLLETICKSERLRLTEAATPAPTPVLHEATGPAFST